MGNFEMLWGVREGGTMDGRKFNWKKTASRKLENYEEKLNEVKNSTGSLWVRDGMAGSRCLYGMKDCGTIDGIEMETKKWEWKE